MNAKSIVIVVLFLALGIGAGLVVGPWVIKASRPAPVASIVAGDYSAYLRPSGKHVVLFSLSTCPHCMDAKAYLHEKGILFEEYQIDKSKAAADVYNKLKEQGVPVILTSRHKMLGFTPDDMAKLLQMDSVPAS